MASKIALNGAEIDLVSRELTVDGDLKRLPWRSFDVLVVLAQSPGEVIPKDRLLREVWGGVAVDESNLTQAVAQIRKTLSHLSSGKSYIETIPRIGYRLSAEAIAPPQVLLPVVHEVPHPAPTTPPKNVIRAQSFRIGAVLALTIAALLGLSSILRNTNARTHRIADPSETPFTTLQGDEMSAAFTPDGRAVIFTWDKEGGNPDIYIRAIDFEIVEPFVVSTAVERGPVVSPDGSTVAFLRVLPEYCQIILKSRDGGPERLVTTIDTPHPTLYTAPGPFLAWTSDNNGLIYAHQRRLYLRRLNQPEAVPLTNPPPTAARGDAEPALSPDGRTLVFVRDVSAGRADLYRIGLNAPFEPTSPEQVLLSNDLWNRSPAWHPDGLHIVYNSGSWGRQRLWYLRMDPPPSSAKPIPSAGIDAQQPVISPTTGEILYTRYYFRTEIWKVAPGPESPGMQPLIVSTRFDNSPRISGDGSRIVFQSDRTGWFDVWTSLADGSDLRRVIPSSDSSYSAGSPDLSPDAKQVAFDRVVDGQRDIFVCDISGANLRRLTDNPADDILPRWSRDSKRIYFASHRVGRLAVYKVDLNTGDTTRVSPDGGNIAGESPDGKSLYYIDTDNLSTDLFEMPLPTGVSKRILSGIRQRAFAVTQKGIYFVPAQGPSQIRLFDTGTAKVRTVLSNPVRRIRSVSADASGEIVLATVQGEPSGDLMRISALPAN